MESFEAKAKIDIPLDNEIIKEGQTITVVKIDGRHYLWSSNGIYTLDELYIGERTKTLSNN